MSTDCENLLKKMLVLTPMKRQPLDLVMQDKWMNIGYEDDQLTPYKEPPQSFPDPLRVEIMVNMGFTREEITESLTRNKFDSVTSTYLLLARRPYNLDSTGCESRTGSNHSVRQPGGGAAGVSAASQSGNATGGTGGGGSAAANASANTSGSGGSATGGTSSSGGRGVPRSASATNPSTGGGTGPRRPSTERGGSGTGTGTHLSSSTTASPSAAAATAGPG